MIDDAALATRIAAAVAPADWDDSREQDLADDLHRIIECQTFLLPDSLDREESIRRKERIKCSRTESLKKADAYDAAANTLHDSPQLVGTQLFWANKYAPGSDDLSRAASLLLASDPFPMKAALHALARGERLQAKYATEALNSRKHYADDVLVEWVAELLVRHGLRPTAYPNEFEVGTPSVGNLVVVCAMLRDESPSTARWVVKAATRARKHAREGTGSRPHPWPTVLDQREKTPTS